MCSVHACVGVCIYGGGKPLMRLECIDVRLSFPRNIKNFCC